MSGEVRSTIEALTQLNEQLSQRDRLLSDEARWTANVIDIVGAGGEMVGRHPVGAEESKILDVQRLLPLIAIDGVDKANLLASLSGNPEAESERLPSVGAAVALLPGKVTHAGIEEPGSLSA